jgi:hypothetical protein
VEPPSRRASNTPFRLFKFRFCISDNSWCLVAEGPTDSNSRPGCFTPGKTAPNVEQSGAPYFAVPSSRSLHWVILVLVAAVTLSGKHDQAILHYRNALEIEPDNLKAR